MANEVLTKLRSGMLHYHYVQDESAGEVVDCHLLAEIDSPYRQRFRDEIADQNWIVEYGRKLAEAPFRADFVICTADAAI